MVKAMWTAPKIGRSEVPGPDRSRPWVAEIVGLSAEYGYGRRFLTGKQDWANANADASRGVTFTFTLEEGKVYETYRRTTGTQHDQKFLRVTPTGDIEEITEEEVDQWLLRRLCVARLAVK